MVIIQLEAHRLLGRLAASKVLTYSKIVLYHRLYEYLCWAEVSGS